LNDLKIHQLIFANRRWWRSCFQWRTWLLREFWLCVLIFPRFLISTYNPMMFPRVFAYTTSPGRRFGWGGGQGDSSSRFVIGCD
jgi:hypothetical protein